jgi:prepilin-type N-terminal cleavage/methylation domain-containing protein
MKRVTATRPRHGAGAFTLIELLVSMAVLAMIILMVAQLMNSATAVTLAGNKHIDTDAQARPVLDRMAADFAQMLKRTDVDYYVKGPINYKGHGNGHGYGKKVQTGQQGSDQIAFFSQVPGYYPSLGSQSPLSLVAYRVNEDSTSAAYLKLERMGKGLLWNGVDNSNQPPSNQYFNSPIVFLPLLISDRWPGATDGTTEVNANYEVVGPQVFRFEYYYLLKNGSVTDVPWDTTARPTQTSLTNPVNIGLTDIEAIGVAIAVIDPASRSLISDSSLFDLASDMADFKNAKGNGNSGKKIGDVEAQWNGVLFGDATLALPGVVNTGQTSTGSPVPRAAASAIRIYSRYFDLKTL